MWKNILFFGWFLTPIIYSKDIIPTNISFIWKFNPLYYILNFSRDLLIYGKIPNFSAVILFTFILILSILISYYIFNKLVENIAGRI